MKDVPGAGAAGGMGAALMAFLGAELKVVLKSSLRR
ncbi:glycerate kinase [Escherichia coli]|nr:glycerate kinase [Escherichia coli]